MTYQDNLYKIVLLVHIIAAIVAIGPNFIAASMSRAGDAAVAKLATTTGVIQLPAMFGVLVTGLFMLTSYPDVDGKSAFAQAWVSIAFAVLIVMAVLLFLLARAYRNNNAKLAAPLTGAMHLLTVVVLYSMVFQPGGGA